MRTAGQQAGPGAQYGFPRECGRAGPDRQTERGSAPGPESSILKIRGTEIQQRITELVLEAVGLDREPQLGADAIIGGDQHRILEARRL